MLVGVSAFDLGWGGIQIQSYNYIKNYIFDYIIFAEDTGAMYDKFCNLPNVKEMVHCRDEETGFYAKEHKIDIFFNHTINHVSRKSLYQIKELGIPQVVFHHCAGKPTYDSKDIDALITTSDSNISIIRTNKSFSNYPIHKIPLSLDLDYYDNVLNNYDSGDVLKKWNIPKDAFIIGRIGRIEPGKKPEDFIEIAGQLKKKFGSRLFFIIGGALSVYQKPIYISKLREFARINCLIEGTDIIFTGSLSEKEKIELLCNMDLFLYPTTFEGYGMVFLEAMYCEVPVITYDNYANKEVIGNGGLVYKNEDHVILGVERLIDNSSERFKLGQQGKDLVKNRNGVKQFAEAIDSVLHNTYKHCERRVEVKSKPLNICQVGWGLVDNMESSPEYLQLVHLKRAGYNVDFFCVTPKGAKEVEGVKIHRINHFDPFMLENKPDIVHVHHAENPLSVEAVKWAKSKNIPCVMNIHNFQNSIDEIKNYIAKFVVFSEKEFEYRSKQVSIDKIKIIPNGIDVNKYYNVPRMRNEYIVLFVGQLFRWKGIYSIVDVAEYIRRIYPIIPIIFHVASHVRGEEKEFINHIKEKKLDGIIKVFASSHGERKFGDLLEFYATCNLFFMPTTADCYPTSILEAMASSKPCIATTIGGIPNQIDHNKTGYHIPISRGYMQLEVAAQHIAYLWTHPEEADAMGMAGRKKIEQQNNITNTIQEYIYLYRSMINNETF